MTIQLANMNMLRLDDVNARQLCELLVYSRAMAAKLNVERGKQE